MENTGTIKTTPKNRSAFALLDLVITIAIMGIIGIAGMKMFFSLQSQNHLKSRQIQIISELQNALDALENYLLEAQKDSVVFQNHSLSWQMLENAKSHQATLKGNALYLDGWMVLSKVSDFALHRDGNGWELVLCVGEKNPFCSHRWVWAIQ
ncbi:hypothetical protein [Helicobacter sp. 11S02596-1]|uniref:hypothetical protein n=1 Tax=Helicobacter sp. 11S02596-1 TaxID=1476194 RepID=UPI000BA5677C|nr:hypothetical protein [Helicobacter sp. 11S02596-1]PAF44835.1 hypothetical protein BJI48_02285 [Helicobacter sp. 11S02596-1]